MADLWKLASTFYPWQIGGDRFDLAGLTPDGTRCFAGHSDGGFGVWDAQTGRLEWHDVDHELIPPLAAAGSGPYLPLPKSSGTLPVRLFGAYGYGFPLMEHGEYRLRAVDRSSILDPKTKRSETGDVQLIGAQGDILRLELDTLSDDFAVASFCDQGTTLAVLQPYAVTCYSMVGTR